MSSSKGRLATRGFLESFEKLLVLVYSDEFKGVMRSISLILEGDLLAVTSAGFVVYQINVKSAIRRSAKSRPSEANVLLI